MQGDINAGCGAEKQRASAGGSRDANAQQLLQRPGSGFRAKQLVSGLLVGVAGFAIGVASGFVADVARNETGRVSFWADQLVQRAR
jgi:hypothetical protein